MRTKRGVAFPGFDQDFRTRDWWSWSRLLAEEVGGGLERVGDGPNAMWLDGTVMGEEDFAACRKIGAAHGSAECGWAFKVVGDRSQR